MLRALAATLVIAMTVGPAVAQEKKQVWVFGVGTNTCGTFLKVRDEERRVGETVDSRSLRHWVGGFLTGVNFASKGIVNSVIQKIDLEGHLAWLDKYCREHPLERVFNAAEGLYLELLVRSPG